MRALSRVDCIHGLGHYLWLMGAIIDYVIIYS